MPQNNQQIQFYFGTLEEYYNLSIKNPNAFYITTDTKQIFIGYDEYTSKITVENLENIDLSDTYLKKLSSNETNFIPKINSNGQLISSGFTLGQSVPANAHFLTNVEVDTLFTNATASSAGRMSASDKNKLDTIAEGAEINQNAFSNIAINNTTIQANEKTDTLTFVAGNNITLTPDSINDTITIAATDTTYSNKEAVSNGTQISLVTTGEKYIWNNNAGTITNLSTGVGLIGGPITTSGTIKTKLKSETALSEQSIIGNSLGKTYAVLTDSDGYLAVNVPWTDYNIAIASANGTGGSSGLMSAIDKEKINNLPENLKNTLVLTQSQYDALDPIDANTLYIIVG